MIVPVEVIYLLSIACCAYFSYKTGYKHAVPDAVDQTLFSLEAQGLISIEEDGTVSAARKRD